MRNSPALFAFGASLLWAAIGHAGEPTTEQITYHPEAAVPEGTRSRLIWTGAGLTAGWYAVNLGASYIWADAPHAADWRLPVVGPWLHLGGTRCGPAESSGCDTVTLVFRSAVTLASSVAQLGGLALIGEGIFLRVGEPAQRATSTPRWVAGAAPLEGGGLGFTVSGRF